MKRIKAFLLLLLISVVLLNNISLTYSQGATLDLLQSSEFKIQEEIEKYIQENKKTTAGLAISIFNNNKSFYNKNYGYEDIENKIAIDDDTVFEWGSVSKLLIWVSVYQLWEQDKIDLNEDVRVYLPEDFLKKTNKDEKITMLNLMHHDAGWQEVVVDLFVKDMNDVKDLKETLKKTEPEKIFPVGEIKAYSNWGSGLAAYIVQEITGQEYYEYVHENIFKPLDMKNTALLPDLSDNLEVKEKRKEIKGYTTNNEIIEKDFFHIPLYPVGMATGTMEDLEKFGKALIDWNSKEKIFRKPETYEKLLQPTLYYEDTEIPRNANGFWYIQMGTPVVGHGGNTVAFSSYLLLDPVRKMGVVVMTNQGNEEVYNYEMMPIIFGNYEPTLSPEFSPKNENLEGTYQDARTILKGYMKIYSLMKRMKVEEDKTGEIETNYQGKKYKAKPFKSFLYNYDGEILQAIKSEGKPTILSQAAGDYYRLDKNQILRENILIYLAITSLLYSIIFLVVEFMRFILAKSKKKTIKKDFFNKYNLLALGQIIFVLLNLIIMVSKISNYTILENVKGHVYMSFVFLIGLLAYIVFLPFYFKKISINNRIKVKYIFTWLASFIIVINIYYWQIYLLR